jgi:hypothetical protein
LRNVIASILFIVAPPGILGLLFQTRRLALL